MNTRIPARGPRERNVEVKYDNGAMISIDCIAVENQLRRNMYERSEHLADHNRFYLGDSASFASSMSEKQRNHGKTKQEAV